MTFRPTAEVTNGTRAAILETLRDLQWHNGKKLQDEGGHNVSARIHELRLEGWEIMTRHGANGFAEYRLLSLEKSDPKATKARMDVTFPEAREYVQCGTVHPALHAKIHAVFERLEARQEAAEEAFNMDGWFD